MFENTKEIIDILKEKLNASDDFQIFQSANNGNNLHKAFIHYFENFMQYMIFQYDLCQASSQNDIIHLYDEIEKKVNNNPKIFPFILHSINKILKVRPMKYDMLLDLLLHICDKYNQKDENLLLDTIHNRFLICELFERHYITFEKLSQRIRQKDLPFFIIYLKDKLEQQQYNKWCQSLKNGKSILIQKIFLQAQNLNENEIKILKNERYNPSQIAIFIQKDDYDSFVHFTSQYAIPLDSQIPYSINETDKIFDKLNRPSYVDYSAFCGSTKIFRFLVANKALVNVKTLEYACIGGSSEIIRIISQNKIAFNQKCLNKAIKYFAEIPIIDFITQNSNNQIGIKEMKKAIQSYNFPFFTFYLTQKLIETNDSSNNILLHYSVCKNNLYMTQFLCELMNKFLQSNLINQQNSFQLTPLIQAVSLGNLDIVKILVENGANYNETDDKILFFYFSNQIASYYFLSNCSSSGSI